jgi:adenylate kinase family enzyme
VPFGLCGVADQFLYLDDLFRRAIAEQNEIGKRVKSVLEAGQLVDDATVLSLVSGAITSNTKLQTDGFVLDGYPRNLNQADQLQALLASKDLSLNAALCLNVSDSVLIDRICSTFCDLQPSLLSTTHARHPTQIGPTSLLETLLHLTLLTIVLFSPFFFFWFLRAPVANNKFSSWLASLALFVIQLIDQIDRWVHVPSGRVYHTTYSPPKKAGFDDVTGEPLTQRDDDTEARVMDRLKVYHSYTAPLLDYYKKKGILTTITADTSHEGYVLIQQALKDQFGLLSQTK